MKEIQKQGGFIALVSILIIGSLILVLGMSLFRASLTDQLMSASYDAGKEASLLADACLREGVFRLKENINYAGDESIDIGGKNCTIGPTENVDDQTKRMSSLAMAGDRAHFKKAEEEIKYVVEPKKEAWDCKDCLMENLDVVNDSLVLAVTEENQYFPEGYRLSPELNISGEGTVKDSQIFWQADTLSGASLIIKTRFYNDGIWTDWEEVKNGREIPGLEKGMDLRASRLQTKAIFSGTPSVSPSLHNINVFIEVKKRR